jgi:hypothetical protein
MTKYNFQFEQDKDCSRPCRLVVCVLDHNHHLPYKICVAINDSCQGDLSDRPQYCPLNVVEDENEKNR